MPRGRAPQSALLALASGEQAEFEIVPPETRKYSLGTFDDTDVLLALSRRSTANCATSSRRTTVNGHSFRL